MFQGNIHKPVNLALSLYLGIRDVLVYMSDDCRLFPNSPTVHCALRNSQYCYVISPMDSQLTVDSTKNPERKLSNISKDQWEKLRTCEATQISCKRMEMGRSSVVASICQVMAISWGPYFEK